MEESEVISLSNNSGFPALSAVAITKEASAREYWRIISNNETYVLCFLDSAIGDHKAFEYVSKAFEANNIAASTILLHHPELGITIQSDLGDNSLLKALSNQNSDELMQQSVALLVSIQEVPNLSIPKLTKTDLMTQMQLFTHSFCKHLLELELDDSLLELMEHTQEQLQSQVWANCHFDYERRNLILTPGHQVAVIDYQDLCLGPVGIDLAGLLLDHYHEFDEKLIRSSLKTYQELSTLDHQEVDFFEVFRWGGIQRNLRILGTLSKISIDSGQDFRLQDLPMILSNLLRLIPKSWSCHHYLSSIVQPALEKKLLAL